MTTQQWRLTKTSEPRTLADVTSSREKPVLCWAIHGAAVLPMFVDELGTWIVTSTGGLVRADRDQKQYKLYDQPSRPTKLEDVPDRRVILGDDRASLWFVECGSWYRKTLGQGNCSFVPMNCRPRRWQLTDCCVELETVEVEVLV